MSRGKNARRKANNQYLRRELDALLASNPRGYEARVRRLLDSWWSEMLVRLRSREPERAFETATRPSRKHLH